MLLPVVKLVVVACMRSVKDISLASILAESMRQQRDASDALDAVPENLPLQLGCGASASRCMRVTPRVS